MINSPTSSNPNKSEGLLKFALKLATDLGASDASAELSDEKGLTVNVRCSEVETIENTRDRSFSITVYKGKAQGSATSGDLHPEAVERTVRAAYEIASHTTEDPCAGLPQADELCKSIRDLDLYHPWDIDAEAAIELGIRAEKVALEYDNRIANTDASSVTASTGEFLLGDTLGFLGGYRFSNHSVSLSMIAEDKNGMQVDGWYATAVDPRDLMKPEQLGEKAARKAISRLSPRTLTTRICPVIFEAPVARQLLNLFNAAVSGGSLYRNVSFLCGRLGTSVFPETVSIFEDPFIPRGYGSSPFDDEGVEPSPRFIVEDGVLKGLFLDSYSARKLSLKNTGNAGGPYNLLYRLQPQARASSPDALMKLMGTGLLVTELIGQGVNLATGDFSKGASGFWIENGRVAYPVQGITVAGNLNDMFMDLVAMGDDIDVNTNVQCGSVLLSKLTVAGS